MPDDDDAKKRNQEYVKAWRKKNENRITAARHVMNQLVKVQQERSITLVATGLRRLLDEDEIRTLRLLLRTPTKRAKRR